MEHLPQMRLALRFSDHFSDFGVKEDGACSRASACPLVVWTMEGSVTASAPASWVGAESAAFETRALSGTVSGDRLILKIVREYSFLVLSLRLQTYTLIELSDMYLCNSNLVRRF